MTIIDVGRGLALLCATLPLSAQEHVAPDAPANPLPELSHAEMIRVMDMDDRRPYHRLLIDQLELQRHSGQTHLDWDAEFFRGGDYAKLGVRTAGTARAGNTEDARAEFLWDRIVSRWWSLQAGLRHDWGAGPSRNWLAVGVQGLAPHFIHVEAMFHVGDEGRTALRIQADYDLLLTQRLVLQPEVELEAHGKDDVRRGLGSGLAHAGAGLRLRYELRREIAPYLGVTWNRAFGRTADLRRQDHIDGDRWALAAGIRLQL
jgi:copper resistance protein B